MRRTTSQPHCEYCAYYRRNIDDTNEEDVPPVKETVQAVIVFDEKKNRLQQYQPTQQQPALTPEMMATMMAMSKVGDNPANEVQLTDDKSAEENAATDVPTTDTPTTETPTTETPNQYTPTNR